MTQNYAQLPLHLKAGSHYTANLLRPAIDGCQIVNFQLFEAYLQCPIPLQQSQQPVTIVNEPLRENEF